MAACSTFFEDTGKLPAQEDASSDGLKIGVWLSNQRRLFRKGQLREDRKLALEKLLGNVLDPLRVRLERNLAAYKDYVAKTGKQPERRTVHEGVAIGNWLTNSIKPKKDKLPTELVEKLDALGFVWEAKRKKRLAVPQKPVLQRDTAPLRQPVSLPDSWFGYFELCRALMRTLSRQIKITHTYRGVNVGPWFQMETRMYAEGGFSEYKRLLFKSLTHLNESRGWVLRDWYWHYSHCLEFVFLKSSALTNARTYHGLPLGEWFGKQMSRLDTGTLSAHQEHAMKDLLAIIRDRESTHIPSV
jgi:hypothetical protein